MEIKVDKSKVLEIRKGQKTNIEKVKLNAERLGEVMNFIYLEVIVSAEGSVVGEMTNRLHEGHKHGGCWENCGITQYNTIRK